MRDIALLAPTLIVGAFVLTGVATDATAGNHYSNNPHVITYYLFLTFLFGLLFRWHHDKQRAAERIRALELGHDPARLDMGWAPGRILITIGAGVPLGVFAIAWMASSNSSGSHDSIWIAAALVSSVVLICGTIVLTRLPASMLSALAPPSLRNGYHEPKPMMSDPDALDVAGRRG